MAVCSLGEEHKTVMVSILATVVAAIVLLIVTVAVAGHFSTSLFESYVLPLFMSAFTLLVFWAFLFARHKGKLSLLAEEERKEERKEEKLAAATTTPPAAQAPSQTPKPT